jgi:aminobenzoyl-glutamate transport protein
MKNDKDVIDAMAEAMRSMGLYIVLVFFAAQFVAFFGYSGLGRSWRCWAPTCSSR